MREYEIYQADENDITYTQDYYKQEEHSLTLLKSKQAVLLMESQDNLTHN